MTILFICQSNSGRSQMAEAFFNSLSKKGRAISAGIKPDEKIHPWTMQVMKEIGIDVSQQIPKLITNGLIKKTDKIILMDNGLLKIIPSKNLLKTENWQIEEPLGKSLNRVRKIRDEIKEKVEPGKTLAGGTEVSLSSLKPGKYTFKIKVTDRNANKSIDKTADFTVE